MKVIKTVVMAVLTLLNMGQAPFEVERGNEKIFQSTIYFLRYQDDDFDWQTLESDTLRVHWYNGDANFGQTALSAGRTGLDSVQTLMPLDLARPIEVFIYTNADDFRLTLNPSGEAWVAGHADPALGVVKVLIERGAEQSILMEQRIPHEIMHVMLYRRVGAGYHNIPAWLREGMATLAETYPNPDHEHVLSDAVATDTLIPLKDLCTSFPAPAGEAFLAYAESRSFTDYLHNAYGSSGLLSLAAYYADGVACEQGTERAFGVSLSKLELEWRESALGQKTLGLALRNTMPYLVLLCLVLLVPLIGSLSVIRRKGKDHGPETYAG
jgi:hypothetical protein